MLKVENHITNWWKFPPQNSGKSPENCWNWHWFLMELGFLFTTILVLQWIGISTDGFAPIKHCSKICWPIIAIIYNLASELHFLQPHCLDLNTIPGPNKPWDVDSFLWPLVEEFSELAKGIKAWDASTLSYFILWAYLLLLFGDIPAIALLMHMKGVNGLSLCQTCKIKGIHNCSSNSNTHYVPLQHNCCTGADPPQYDASNLPIWTHNEFIQQMDKVQLAPNHTTHEKLAKEYSIKGRCILASIPSISFPESFPFDFLHLIWENLIPNLICFWTGEFKELYHKDVNYVIAPHCWKDSRALLTRAELLCSLADANSAAALAQWYKW